LFLPPYLHDGSLLNIKNQVADDAGIFKKIGARILNFRKNIDNSGSVNFGHHRVSISGSLCIKLLKYSQQQMNS
jgi:hypothetical protein